MIATGGAGAAFVRGLSKPSLLSVATAAVVVAMAFVASLVLITPRLIASDAIGYFAATGDDYDAFVTSRVLGLARSDDRRPLIALVGASVTRMAFGTEAELAAAIRVATGRDVEVAVLCTGRQSLLEQAAIVEELLGVDRPVVFVIGVAPGRFNRTVAEMAEINRTPRLGFRSAAVDREAARLGLPPFEPAGSYFLDNRGFLLPRMKHLIVNGLLKGPVRLREVRYTGQHQDRDAFRADAAEIIERFEAFDSSFDANAGILLRMLERIEAAPGKRALLVEETINPVFLSGYLGRDFLDRYRMRVDAIARREGVAHLSLDRRAGLAPEDYYDWAHVSSPDARARMRALLAQDLGPYLQ